VRRARADRRPALHPIRILAASGLVAIAAVAAAQSASPPPATTTASRARRPTPEMASVTGTVKQYRKGKSIVVVGPDGRGRKLVIDGTTHIDGPVTRGQSVTAVWMTDDAGRPHVHSISTYPRASAESAASPSGPTEAAPTRQPTPEETAVPPTATPHGPAEDATTPSPRRTPLPGPP
jgi:membrane peptidoglycan carboxypeptidase